MKLVLIQTPVPELLDDRLDPPIGLMYLADYVKDIVDVEIVDLSGMEFIPSDIPKADFYGFSTYTANYHRTLEILEDIIFQYPDCKTIAGGPHATALPEQVAQDFDYVVMGEGERLLREILKGKMSGIYKGFPIDSLDELSVDYDMIDFESYHRIFANRHSVQIFTSRGCHYNCAFCQSDNNVRRRSPINVIEEIEALQNKFGDISVRFKDDLFASKLSWIEEYARYNFNVPYSCNIRGNCNPKILDYLAQTGCNVACIGIESGSALILNNMQKNITPEQTGTTVKSLKGMGIQVLGWFIVGFPGETWDTVKQTVEFINELDLDKSIIYPLIPYPGTDVYENRKKYGIEIIEQDFSKYFYIMGDNSCGFVYRTETLTPEIIREMRDYVIANIPPNKL